jgi:heme oxygenase
MTKGARGDAGPFFFAPGSASGHRQTMSAALALRTRTRVLHDRVDAAFAALSLADEADYRRFLHAHALALPPAEAMLATATDLPGWLPRAPLLAADLADLGAGMPAALDFAAPRSAAAAWGVFYVVEGSRLGGAMLARQVGAGLPRRYLAAAHRTGEWKAQREAIDMADAGTAAWIEQAVAGADACFALYARAARAVTES